MYRNTVACGQRVGYIVWDCKPVNGKMDCNRTMCREGDSISATKLKTLLTGAAQPPLEDMMREDTELKLTSLYNQPLLEMPQSPAVPVKVPSLPPPEVSLSDLINGDIPSTVVPNKDSGIPQMAFDPQKLSGSSVELSGGTVPGAGTRAVETSDIPSAAVSSTFITPQSPPSAGFTQDEGMVSKALRATSEFIKQGLDVQTYLGGIDMTGRSQAEIDALGRARTSYIFQLGGGWAGDILNRTRMLAADWGLTTLTPQEQAQQAITPRTGTDTALNAGALYLELGAPGAWKLFDAVAGRGFGAGEKIVRDAEAVNIDGLTQVPGTTLAPGAFELTAGDVAARSWALPSKDAAELWATRGVGAFSVFCVYVGCGMYPDIPQDKPGELQEKEQVVPVDVTVMSPKEFKELFPEAPKTESNSEGKFDKLPDSAPAAGPKTTEIISGHTAGVPPPIETPSEPIPANVPPQPERPSTPSLASESPKEDAGDTGMSRLQKEMEELRLSVEETIKKADELLQPPQKEIAKPEEEILKKSDVPVPNPLPEAVVEPPQASQADMNPVFWSTEERQKRGMPLLSDCRNLPGDQYDGCIKKYNDATFEAYTTWRERKDVKVMNDYLASHPEPPKQESPTTGAQPNTAPGGTGSGAGTGPGYEGIGMAWGSKDPQGFFKAGLPMYSGTPYDRSGVQFGDAILQINGQDTRGMDGNTVTHKIRGPAGTQVRLLVFRSGWSAPRLITITRDWIR